MRTLVISDIHAGSLAGHCVLERPSVRDALAERTGPLDRLVLLGDLLELREGRPDPEVQAIATPVLAALAGLAPEIVLVPGNHDRRLVASWIAERGESLELESAVPPDASALLAWTVGHLGAAGAQVRVHYPGVTLAPGVFATHGHYLDPALTPEGPYGLFFRHPGHHPWEYERRHRPERQRLGGMVGLTKEHLLTPAWAPLTVRLLDLQMRRHSLVALGRVLDALGVRADHVIFGHVHRLGPLTQDAPGPWTHVRDDGGIMHFHNTGAWVEETLLLGGRRPRIAQRPYRPGGAVEIGDDGVPRARALLGPAAGASHYR